MPGTAQDLVSDLHILLQRAHIPGPYVLVAHSFGGIFARLYASTYPEEVVGMVLVDALSESVRSGTNSRAVEVVREFWLYATSAGTRKIQRD
jgi:pimeloyl-ACP methyl ester carboxylesterase